MADEATTTPGASGAGAAGGEATPPTTPTLQDGVLAKLAGRQPGLAKVVQGWKGGGKPEEGGGPGAGASATEGGSLPKKDAEAGEDDAAETEDEAATGGDDSDTEDTDSEGEGDDSAEPEEGETVEQQLAKLQKGQKKTLKRLDKLTQDKRELERLLAEERAKNGEATGPEAAVASFPQLADVSDLAGLETRVGEIRQWLKTLGSAQGGGMKVKDANGEEREATPEEVAQHVIFWSEVLAEQVPARRAFLETREKARQEAADKFKPWQEKKDFTEARAQVEKGMKPVAQVLPDFDLALNERALGKLVLSGAYELVPKRKAAAAGAGTTPAKKAPTPPPNAPGGGGPPVRPAGQGPDIEELKQRMLKNPGNKAAVQAYVKATMAKAG